MTEDDELDAAEAEAASMTLGSKLLFAGVIAAVLAIAFGPRIVRIWHEEAVAESGVRAPATVVELDETGNISNEVHELRITVEVRPEGAAAYQASLRKFVPPSKQAAIQPGTEITVKYDPQAPERIAIIEPKLE